MFELTLACHGSIIGADFTVPHFDRRMTNFSAILLGVDGVAS